MAELTIVHGETTTPDEPGGIEFRGESDGEWLWSDYSVAVGPQAKQTH